MEALPGSAGPMSHKRMERSFARQERGEEGGHSPFDTPQKRKNKGSHKFPHRKMRLFLEISISY
jgi:hypothetical protein